MSQKLKSVSKTKSEAKQKVALHALVKQLQNLRLKEALILIAFTFGAGLLRVPMQSVPSAEPITFFAILAGWLFGRNKGFLVGAGALITSNFFVFGGHGPWTIFQAVGFGLAGWLGGFLNEKAGYLKTAVVAIAATLVFEIIINASTWVVFPTGILSIVTALPFIGMHFFSNLIFSFGLKPAKKLIYEKGNFNEKALTLELIDKLKSSVGMSKSE